MERLSLRKALLKFYEGGDSFTVPQVLNNEELTAVLNCATALTRSRVRDEVTAIIREGLAPGKIDKTGSETVYKIMKRRRGEISVPQYSKAMRAALGLAI